VISYEQTYSKIRLLVGDHGIGIFQKIQNDFHLADARTALLELSKGKLTSNKRAHSGEGIYYTSRMFGRFTILSGHLCYDRVMEDDEGWLIEVRDQSEERKGTWIDMQISTNADWTTRSVFEKYQGDDIYFRKTHVPVSLGKYPGEQLVSRSQAKRILARFTNFAEVLLDFRGVDQIGQAFADEIFRVFQNEHPGTPIIAIRANDAVKRMIDYVKSQNNIRLASAEKPSSSEVSSQ
jgi:hypothetical protein